MLVYNRKLAVTINLAQQPHQHAHGNNALNEQGDLEVRLELTKTEDSEKRWFPAAKVAEARQGDTQQQRRHGGSALMEARQ